MLIAIDPGEIGNGVAVFDGFKFHQHYFTDVKSLSEFIAKHAYLHEIDALYMETGNRTIVHDNKAFTTVFNTLNHILAPVLINNAGIKKVITDDMMKLLGVYDEKIKTHHKDIRSAMRVLLLAMIRDDKYKQEIERRLNESIK